MEDLIPRIRKLFAVFSSNNISSIEKLPQSGSDRQYYRLYAEDESGRKSYIATFSPDTHENETFISWSRHFHKMRLAVPVIYAFSHDRQLYIQEDLGSTSLLDARLEDKDEDKVYHLYEKSLYELARIQVLGNEGLDYTLANNSGVFAKEAILHDLLYFKFYFLDPLKLKYDREKLLAEFDVLAEKLSGSNFSYFMFRDFQGRNIMVRNEEVVFIDFQGGMKGPIAYDAASLLWQARAELSMSWRTRLFQYYIQCVEEITKKPLDRTSFEREYQGFVLLRLLQVLGAYGFRGLFERKQHFLSSIPGGIKNLADYKKNCELPPNFTELSRVMDLITSDATIERFRNISGEEAPLLVTINSFSFTQRGYPDDKTGTGGGFVFDCRGILNPGRIDEYKPMTGRDEPVKVFLEQNTRMPDFLKTVFETVDIAVENYIERGFENLTVNFGCTGGRHRSVYAADALARHLSDKYKVRTSVKHMEQNFPDDI